MATSKVSAVIDALVAAAATALPDVKVYDGFGISGSTGDYLMIGVEDPDNQDAASSADWSQSWSGLGNKAREEEGTITCAALSWHGGKNQKTARDGAFAILAAVETLVRGDPTLGGVIVSGWAQMGGTFRLEQAQGKSGTDALVVFQIHFKTRL